MSSETFLAVSTYSVCREPTHASGSAIMESAVPPSSAQPSSEPARVRSSRATAVTARGLMEQGAISLASGSGLGHHDGVLSREWETRLVPVLGRRERATRLIQLRPELKAASLRRRGPEDAQRPQRDPLARLAPSSISTSIFVFSVVSRLHRPCSSCFDSTSSRAGRARLSLILPASVRASRSSRMSEE